MSENNENGSGVDSSGIGSSTSAKSVQGRESAEAAADKIIAGRDDATNHDDPYNDAAGAAVGAMTKGNR
jgi:hypothetical protein